MSKRTANLKLPGSKKHPGVDFLLSAFKEKKDKNPRFSIRGFARFLEVDQSMLAKTLKGVIKPSPNWMAKCLVKLNAGPEVIAKVMKSNHRDIFYDDIHTDEYELISDWRYFAILEFMSVSGFKLGPRVVSEKFQIPVKQAQEYIDCLLKHRFISKTSNGYKLDRPTLTWYSNKHTDEARIKSQKIILDLSQQSLDSVDISERDHSSVIMAIKKEDMKKYKEWIKDARRQLITLFQQSQDFDDVYCLQMSFFPMVSKEVQND